MREAVSAILVCGSDVFIIRRQNHLRAFPGYYAFPGGKVDANDRDGEISHPLLAPFSHYQVNALARELQEELGFDLEQALAQGVVNALSYFGEAITPPFGQIRFNAHYLKIELNRRPDFQPDRQEIAWSGWLHHKELDRLYRNGEALMVVPIINTVRTLADEIGAQRATPFNLQYDVERELPYLEPLNAAGIIPVPANTLPPAKNTNALLIGDASARCILVDPSPRSEAVYRKLLRTLSRRRLDGILISHHHHDHHELAPRLARELNLPLYCSARTLDNLRALYQTNQLSGIEIATLAEGDVLTHWLGQPVRCHALPGHDDGMLGLAPDNMAWFFIADLAQQGATVVIPEHGGDMRSYFDSLNRVIDLKPKVLIPSHGLAMGGTHLLEKALAHRLKREQEVRCYLEAGLEPEAILNKIYPDLSPGLRQFARQNIKQHLKKLALDMQPRL